MYRIGRDAKSRRDQRTRPPYLATTQPFPQLSPEVRDLLHQLGWSEDAPPINIHSRPHVPLPFEVISLAIPGDEQLAAQPYWITYPADNGRKGYARLVRLTICKREGPDVHFSGGIPTTKIGYYTMTYALCETKEGSRGGDELDGRPDERRTPTCPRPGDAGGNWF